MAADVALNRETMAAYPFCRLTDTANVLIMPAFHSASISTKMLQELGGATVIGPLIVGLEKPVQIVAARRQGFRHRQYGGAGELQYRGTPFRRSARSPYLTCPAPFQSLVEQSRQISGSRGKPARIHFACSASAPRRRPAPAPCRARRDRRR